MIADQVILLSMAALHLWVLTADKAQTNRVVLLRESFGDQRESYPDYALLDEVHLLHLLLLIKHYSVIVCRLEVPWQEPE